MSKCRLDRWAEQKVLLTLLTGDADSEHFDKVSALKEAAWARGAKQVKFTSFSLIEASREIVFDIQDGLPVFTFLVYSLDVEQLAIVVQATIESHHDPSDDPAEVEEDVLMTLAIAAGLGVPVYPNTADVAPILSKYHRTMLLEGFTAPDAEGKKTRLQLTRSPGARIDDPHYLEELDPTDDLSPAEVLLIQDAVTAELARLHHADQALAALRFSISELEALLTAKKRNEAVLQRCLTENPALFGPDYVQVLPKHVLGAEYEMDYALVRHTGLVDLVEIEACSLPVFNKNGDPSRYLVHAEQQVIDWLAWVERHSSYARERLPEIMAPVGYVVIGRSESTPEDQLERLRRRNALFRGALVVLTYDQLLERAKNVLGYMEGAPIGGESGHGLDSGFRDA